MSAIVHIEGVSDLPAIATAVSADPGRPVLAVIGSGEPEHALCALELGALGLASATTSAAELAAISARLCVGEPVLAGACAALVVRAIHARRVRRRDFELTAREVQVLGLLVEGCETTEIAARLGITFSTAQSHLKNVFRKLQVRSRAQATAIAVRNHLV